MMTSLMNILDGERSAPACAFDLSEGCSVPTFTADKIDVLSQAFSPNNISRCESHTGSPIKFHRLGVPGQPDLRPIHTFRGSNMPNTAYHAQERTQLRRLMRRPTNQRTKHFFNRRTVIGIARMSELRVGTFDETLLSDKGEINVHAFHVEDEEIFNKYEVDNSTNLTHDFCRHQNPWSIQIKLVRTRLSRLALISLYSTKITPNACIVTTRTRQCLCGGVEM
ncbi:hypothetical protein N431DRAFT_431684 [Stipitochalara longipes BDJ]|nr:hypothetical protein N431DRAFT_431684 [Stipitochalara longipes BDJ]